MVGMITSLQDLEQSGYARMVGLFPPIGSGKDPAPERNKPRVYKPVRRQSKERGLFIVLEGLNCSGKSTLAAALAQPLSDWTDRETVIYRDPYDTPDNPFLDLLNQMKAQPEKTDPVDLAYAFMLNRRHLWNRIDWELDDHRNVICDRWTPSTLVYQLGTKSNYGLWAKLADFGTDVLQLGTPDLLVILRTSWETYQVRLAARKVLKPGDTMTEAQFKARNADYGLFNDAGILQLSDQHLNHTQVIRHYLETSKAIKV